MRYEHHSDVIRGVVFSVFYLGQNTFVPQRHGNYYERI